ncbi:MAG: glycine--tRNA ligase [Candidatus Wildermuthbacteria bacterium RIFCSPLOWO2_02_FULL_47_10]|nr:MAG: Glycine-tRNA ligase [Parcubacteria group bacterium GW2011_GWA2_47_9]OHA75335.1 MAG: glycine--tRNA ligase [Candidatus Wildermuthbacteria bacterium RIFCSPLOWO2_02_FULL_47_10]
MQKIVSLAKRRGFIFQASEIYGGVEALWDYGPLGALLKNNIKREWLKCFVQERDDVVLVDGTVIMHPKTWEASGHLESFTDPLVECKSCHKRYRADQLVVELPPGTDLGPTNRPFAVPGTIKKVYPHEKCQNCGGELTNPKNFNLMFKTFLGPVENEASVAYLRPETAQTMFEDFKLVQESQRLKLPFGIAQIGRCFRNEITTGNFIFRSREFDIAEIEYFVKPEEDEEAFNKWLDAWEQFFIYLGLKKENLRRYEHPKESLAHYSKRTVDIEYHFPFGWAELAGVANRTDFDLSQHAKFSGQDLRYFDDEIKERYFPYVIEPTLGIERLLLALLADSYEEVKGGRTTTTEAAKEEETVLRLNKKIAPIQVAVLPLLKNNKELVARAKEIYEALKPHFMCQYDEVGTIGRRYRRQDEIGTPACITVDHQTLQDNTVTLRDRDTMSQERVSAERLPQAIDKLLKE